MGIYGLPCLGFLIGVLIISLGGGGGGFYVGILTAFFQVPPAVAAATSLATIIPTTAIGSFSHWKAGNVNLHLGGLMMLGAIVGALGGSGCSDLLPLVFYRKLTGMLLFVLGMQMAATAWQRRTKKTKQNIESTGRKKFGSKRKIRALGYGFLGGFMSGLVGVSGTGPIIAGLTILGCGALETVGTSVFVLVGIATAGFFMHLGLGNVNWRLVGLLVLGTSTGAFTAPYILQRFDRAVLEKCLPPVLIVLTLFMGIIILFS